MNKGALQISRQLLFEMGQKRVQWVKSNLLVRNGMRSARKQISIGPAHDTIRASCSVLETMVSAWSWQ